MLASAMRTTINIEDELLERMRDLAKRRQVSFRALLSRVLRLGLERLDPRSDAEPYSTPTFSMGFPPHLDLDKAIAIASDIEDEETVRKLQVRK